MNKTRSFLLIVILCCSTAPLLNAKGDEARLTREYAERKETAFQKEYADYKENGGNLDKEAFISWYLDELVAKTSSISIESFEREQERRRLVQQRRKNHTLFQWLKKHLICC